MKLDALPAAASDWSPIIDAMKRGDYFWTSGEVLIPTYAVQGAGSKRTIAADVEWTFPLDFVEVVWGDGEKTDRQIIPATDLPPFGRKHFEIPFDATGQEVGAIRGVGHGRQRRDGAADQADDGADGDAIALSRGYGLRATDYGPDSGPARSPKPEARSPTVRYSPTRPSSSRLYWVRASP